jgi:dTDP-4-amino-4,6-dideoxygalactose transaminase
MKVPILDLNAQYVHIREEVRAAIDRVCDSQQFILGSEVAALEAELAAYCGSRFAVGLSSGTDALLAALMAVGVKPGDEVITTPYSFFATAGVIVRLGARPVFADIRADTFNLDPAAAVERITARTKAIIPVHLFGRCADLEPILAVAEEPGLPLIEDAAQAIGSTDEKGRNAGTIGLIGCLSFFPSKNLGAFGDGGMAITNDQGTDETLRTLRVHGSNPKYFHRIVGGNFRLDALQAAVLRVKLKYLRRWSEARRANAHRYRRLFENAQLHDLVVLPADTPGHIYNQFVIRVPNRDRLQAFLEQRQIGTEVYYPLPLHLQECFKELGYRKGDLPEAERASEESLALPIYPELTAAQQEYVVSQIKEFYETRSRRVASEES